MKYFEGSVFFRYLKKISQEYLALEEKISFIFLNSFTRQLVARVAELIKIGFKFSFFGRLTEIKQDIAKNFFETSKTAKIVLKCMKDLKNEAATSYTNIFFNSLGSLRFSFFLEPLKVGGIIIIAMITTNLVLSIILQKQIALWGWTGRGLLLFIGINGLFCNANLDDIKGTSFSFKYINNLLQNRKSGSIDI